VGQYIGYLWTVETRYRIPSASQPVGCLAGDFIDDAVWNASSLGQYPTCYTHGTLQVARQLITVAITSLTIRLHRYNSLVLETKTGISPSPDLEWSVRYSAGLRAG
jgi:hypothetical protein